jgi:formate/nitrite transporter FocA (FNT family)
MAGGRKGGVGDVLANIVPVTAGNLVGGAVVAAELLEPRARSTCRS